MLRDWREQDLPAWAALNADPQVREHLGDVWDEQRSAAAMELYQEAYARNGFSFWAVEERASGQLIGMAGLDVVEPDMPFTGVEIGWRLARGAWGQGFASEAARAVLDFGFTKANLTEILAITLAANVRSQAVMRRIGMTHAIDLDFSYEGDDHIVYRSRLIER